VSDELTISALGAGRYEVRRTRDGETAVYEVDPNQMRCTCPSGTHGRVCRHLKAVLAQLEGRAQA
jgi:uncharacterized Zn finger protein